MSATPYHTAEAQLWRAFRITPTDHTITIRALDTQVRVQDIGEDTRATVPTLFIHGGPNAGSTFAPLIGNLPARRTRVLDRPGCGLSGPIDYARHRMPHVAVETLRATLDALSHNRVDLVASSLGGAWALWFALAHPDRVRRLVLLGAPALVPGMRVPSFMRMLLMPVLGGLIARMPPNPAATRWTHEQMGHSPDVLTSMLPAAYWAWSVALMTHTATMASDVRGIHSVAPLRGVRPEVEFTATQLNTIETPTLLYWGDADTFGGEALARTIAQLMPNAALELVGGAGHLPWLDDPGRAARSIANFLQVPEASAHITAA